MTPKQKRFAIEYLADANATQAAIRAGYAEVSAHTTGYRLLKNDDVSKFIEQAQSDARNAATLNLEDTMLLLSSIALDETENTRNRIAAISVLSKLNGWEQPQRHEIGVTEISINRITPDMIGECDYPLEEVTEPCSM